MKARVTWLEDRTFVGFSGSGHSVILGTKGQGEHSPGPSAMELVLIGAGGCSAWDVVSILEKARQKISDVSVELEADRAETDPKVFTRIHLRFTVTGRGVDLRHAERAVQLSVEKYCSAMAMLEKTAKVSHEVTVVEAD